MLTRYAPSPTGHLHLGHVVNAIYVWGMARAAGGRVLLRMEDHDRIRCRPEYEARILEDLEWLGFEPDGGLHPLVRQSERDSVYRGALDRLRSTHHIYACECSRKHIAGERYDGYCRERGLDDRPGRGLRVRMDAGVERVDDLLLGAIEQTPARLRLRRMLGRLDPPRFAHHPLILKSSGEKLSKSAADTGVRELRRASVNAEEVIGRAAAAVGLIDQVKSIAARDVADLFKTVTLDT